MSNSKFSIKQTNGKYVHVGDEGQGPFMYTDCQYPEYYSAHLSEGVFIFNDEHYAAACCQGHTGVFEQIRDYRLIDTCGRTYILDWSMKTVIVPGTIAVPVKECISRTMPKRLIPAIWKKHKQLYIDHICLKTEPFDFCYWRYEDVNSGLTNSQSMALDEVDFAVKRYISNLDKTALLLNWKVRAVHNGRKLSDKDNTTLLIMPLVIEPLEALLVEHECYEVMKRFYQAKKKVQKMVDELGKLPPPGTVVTFVGRCDMTDAPF